MNAKFSRYCFYVNKNTYGDVIMIYNNNEMTTIKIAIIYNNNLTQNQNVFQPTTNVSPINIKFTNESILSFVR